ncbi:Rhodanese-like domain-containing protein, partial [Phlyctochytrium arcticum]
LVSTQWLADNLHKVVVIDATWYLQPQVSSKPEDAWMLAGTTPAPRKDARKEYTERHIEGSRYFDLDEVSDHITKLPHMLPTPEDFEDHVRELGITADDHIVVYDSQGIFSAPRVWWTFKVFGHKNVSVLDGGLPKWLKEGRNVKSGQESFTPSDYRANFNEAMVIDFNTMLVHVTDFMYAHNFQILDARPRGRFGGYQPEPRAGLPSGHIPSAINIPASELVDPDTKTLLPREAIMRRMFLDNVDLSRPLVTMCGTGVTAAILYLALEVIGKTDDVRLYDGSWAEWASKKKVPITAWQ